MDGARYWNWVVVGLGLGAACGSDYTGILVDVTSLPPRAASVAIQATLDGQLPVSISVSELPTTGLDRFALRVPSSLSGQLSISLSALDADRCTQGSAANVIRLPTDAGHALNASISAQSPRRCDPLPSCSGSVLCAVNSKPLNNSLEAVWAISPTDIWAVGLLGTVLHWDGAGWKGVNVGTALNLWDVWASSPQDVWVVGQATTTSFATILHFDGQAWQVSPNTVANDLNGVWGLGTNDIYAVGNPMSTSGPGEFWHWDGVKWSRMANTVPGLLYRVWASSPTDIWAAGFNGTLIRHDGSTSTAINLTSVGFTSTTNLLNVWGTGPKNVFVIGAGGLAAHYDGTTWTRMTQQGSSTTSTLSALMGTGVGQTVYVGGNNGWMFTSDPPYTTLVPMQNPPAITTDLREIAIGRNGIGWAVGVAGFLGYFDQRP